MKGVACLGLLVACNRLDADQSGTRSGPRAGDGGNVALDDVPGAPGSDDSDLSGPGANTDPIGMGSNTDPDGPPNDGPAGDPAAPEGTPSEATGTTTNPSDPDAVPTTPLDPTQAGLAEFTRLTRAEYSRSVEAAFGIVPDIRQLPEDGRTGPFTSNATETAEPVHPYLLLAESLAAQVVPEVLPACERANLQPCLERDYVPAFAALERRAGSDAEVSAWAELVTSLLDQGATEEAASRALVAAVLTGSDFLHRSSSARSDVSLAARGAERLSFALWDAPPDAELGVPPEGTEALGTWLGEQTVRLLQDERSTSVITRFVAQWLDVDSDLLLENEEYADGADYQELLARVRLALDSDSAVRELIGGRSGVVHRDNSDIYGVDVADEETLQEVQWPADSTRRGVLAQELFSAATRHPDLSRRPIFRGLLVRRALLCDPIPAPSAELVALAGEVGDRTQDARCSSCHLRLDPIGRAFAAWDEGEEAVGAEVIGHAELEGTYSDVGALLDAVADSRAFAECFSKHWLAFFLEQPLAEVDPAWIALLADEVEAGASLSRVMQSSVRELVTRSESFVPWCEESP